MRRQLLVLLLVGISAITSGCGLCGRAPLIPQAYVAPACDPCRDRRGRREARGGCGSGWAAFGRGCALISSVS